MDKAREFTKQKKKSQALMCLKKKKMYEQQLERLDALVSRCGDGRSGRRPQGLADTVGKHLAAGGFRGGFTGVVPGVFGESIFPGIQGP
jgi:hypothetical protein